MQRHAKPVRNCHACLLNQGDHCWLYAYPRGQWRRGRRCPAFDNEEAYARFRAWRREPTVLSRRELRQQAFRTRRRRGVQART
jgi:hypothetical protein